MSLSRALLVTVVLVGCITESESQARCRLFGRRCARWSQQPSAAPAPGYGHGPGEVCRNAEIMELGGSSLYSCVICDDGMDALLFADSGLPVDDVGNPCDNNPAGACEPASIRKKKIERVYVWDQYANDGLEMDKKITDGGLFSIDVKYDRAGTTFFARVYIFQGKKFSHYLALPISQGKAINPQLAEAKQHEKKLDVLTLELKDGTKIKGASIREK